MTPICGQPCTRSTRVKQALSPVCYNDGTPLGALPLHRAAYDAVKGTVSSQLTISAIRVVAAAYASAKRNKKPAKRPFSFGRPSALFLIGERGRDADFRSDGTVSIWTVAGRKHITYTVPEYFKPMFAAAVEFDSLTLIERNGRVAWPCHGDACDARSQRRASRRRGSGRNQRAGCRRCRRQRDVRQRPGLQGRQPQNSTKSGRRLQRKYRVP